MRKIFSALVACMIFTAAYSQPFSFVKETHRFAVKDGQELLLDKYAPAVDTGSSPCVLFMFGGAFARGARDVEKYMPYFDYLVANGLKVVSIDYRLGLKGVTGDSGMSEEEFIRLFTHTVDMAVEDLFDATDYILRHAGEWNIDPEKIILNGSSAGAVTVLQGEYALVNRTMTSSRLPRDFRYAGVLSFAGAILSLEGDLVWNRTPAPMMLLHGDADLQVPYNELRYGPVGFFGAKTIARTLKEGGYPYYFLSYDNYGHEIASDPMQDKKEEVLYFIRSFVLDGQQLQIDGKQVKIGKPEVEKNFGIYDYIRGNFDR